MADKQHPPSLLRSRTGAPSEGRVGFVELFFDLVFVFAVTQLSHGLLAHLTPLGMLQTAMLLVAVWWVWIDTTWITNWFDVDRMPVRLMLFTIMALGLLMSLSIPEAFDERGLVFVSAFLTIQIGRSVFGLLGFRHDVEGYRNFWRILIWFLMSGIFWLMGALAEGEARMSWWLIALAIDCTGPMAGFWIPPLGGSTTQSWNVSGEHMAERCGLFIIIALGESILITGATFAEVPWTGATIAAFASAFLATVAMWWIYFNIGATRGSAQISHHQDPGRVARLAYTYFHIPIVAGVIAAAAADELVLAHPGGHAEPMAIALILGGPAIYLAGNIAFKRNSAEHMPLSHLIGLGLLAIVTAIGLSWPPLALSIASTAILMLVAIWETLSWRRGPTS